MVGGLPSEVFGALPVPGLLPQRGHVNQGEGVAVVGGLPSEVFGALPIPGLLPHPGQVGQGAGVAVVGGLPVEVFGALPVPGLLPHPGQVGQGASVAVVGGLPSEVFGALPIPGPLPHPGQAGQGAGVAVVGGLPVEVFGALPIPGLLPQLGQAEQGVGAAVVGGAVSEVVGPLQAVPGLGCRGKVVQIVGVGEVGEGGVPEGNGRTQRSAGGAAVLFEVVGEPEHRPRSRRGRDVGRREGRGRSSSGPGRGVAQGGLFAVDQLGEFSEGLLDPVLGELVVFSVIEIVGGSVGEKCLRQVEANAQAARVHRRLQHSSGRRGRPFVAVEQLGGTGQVLSHSPVGVGAGEGIG